jgi:hypothetical protein
LQGVVLRILLRYLSVACRAAVLDLLLASVLLRREP